MVSEAYIRNCITTVKTLQDNVVRELRQFNFDTTYIENNNKEITSLLSEIEPFIPDTNSYSRIIIKDIFTNIRELILRQIRHLDYQNRIKNKT